MDFIKHTLRKGKVVVLHLIQKKMQKKKSILPKVFLWIGTIITLLVLFIQAPKNAASETSECCSSQVSNSCGSGCNTENSGCCPSSSESQQTSGECCSTQQEDIQESCCGN
ncbi:MAG: hypothetical protein Q4F50_13885 [Bacteroides sp.]|uniref:hypothetical protein n=1 Tax=Bacteroides sp. TaxID=29523 RepID=UPI0026E04821|nr:hypothetical protein [Bacteroides sp.]MDO5421134.1 hypothetical protein [Bacteroides sp.]